VVVTEVTPWFSEAIAAWTHTNLWQFASYRGGYSGDKKRDPVKVRIYGWLFYDDAHVERCSGGRMARYGMGGASDHKDRGV
jgi:hypothetical protein